MRLLEELRDEHGHIDRMLGALRTHVARRASSRVDPRDGPAFVEFFRLYADGYHHAREEDVLFPALVAHLEVPADRGPLAILSADHARFRAWFGELAELLATDGNPERLAELAVAYSRALWLHIDVENSVLLPESGVRLARAGIRELPSRAPHDDEARALSRAPALLLRYPPSTDGGIVRGEGCVVCPSYGGDCAGLEREWWSENEWEEFPDRVG